MPGSTAGIMNVSATTRCAFAAEDTSQATNREVTTAKWRTGFLSRRSSFLHRQLQSADELARHSPHHPSCGAAGARFRVCIIIHVWRVSWDFSTQRAASVELYFLRLLRASSWGGHTTVATSGLPCCRHGLKAFKRLLFRLRQGPADARIDWHDAL